MVTYLHHEPSWRPHDQASLATVSGPPPLEGWPEPPASVGGTPAPTDPADQQPPMGLGTLFGVGLRIMRQRYKSLMAVALVVAVPAMLLALLADVNYQSAYRDVYGDEGGLLPATFATDEELQEVDSALAPFMLTALLQIVLFAIAWVGFAAIVGADFYARPVRASVGLGACRSRWLSAIAAVAVYSLALIGLVIAAVLVVAVGLIIAFVMGEGVIGLISIVVGVVVAFVLVVYPVLRWSAAFSVMAVEDLGWRDSLGRSWRLTRRRTLRVAAVTIIVALVAGLAWVFGSLLLSELIMGTIGTASGWDRLVVDAITSMLLTLLLLPVYSVFATVLYFDLRARARVEPRPQPTWGATQSS